MFSLRPWQTEAIEYGIGHPYCILAMAMGLGKTLTSLTLKEKLKVKKALVICPSYLITNWESEITKFYPGLVSRPIRSKKDISKKVDYDIAIISYDMAQKAEYLFSEIDMLICDEAHYLKTMTAKRTEFIHKAVYENSIKYCYLLTGTPIKNKVTEYYSLMSLCYYNPRLKDPKFIKEYPSQFKFNMQFSNMVRKLIPTKYGRREVIDFTGVKNIPLLKSYLQGIYFKRDKSVLGLNEPSYLRILVDNKYNKDLYEAFLEFENRTSKSGVLPEIKRESAEVKTPYTYHYVKDLEGSVVIYSDHRAPVESLSEKLGCPFIHGSVNAKTRGKIVEEFEAGKHSYLCATIGALSTGVNLIRASHIVFNDLSWVPGDMDQVIGRMMRLGQTKDCSVHYILGSPQDAKILETLEDKRKVISETT